VKRRGIEVDIVRVGAGERLVGEVQMAMAYGLGFAIR
jgi:hypothetical protein